MIKYLTGSKLREELPWLDLRIPPVMVSKCGPCRQKCASEIPPHISMSEEAENRKYCHGLSFLLPHTLLSSLDSWSIELCCLHSEKVLPTQLIISDNSLVDIPRSRADNENQPSQTYMNSRMECIKHYGDHVQFLENMFALLLQGLGHAEALSGMRLPAVIFLIINGVW